MSLMGRIIGHVSPSRHHRTAQKEGELTVEQQEEILQIFKVNIRYSV